MNRKNIKKIISVLFTVVLLCGMFSSCKSDAEKQASKNEEKSHPVATIAVKDYGVMEKQPLTEGRNIWMMLAPAKA